MYNGLPYKNKIKLILIILICTLFSCSLFDDNSKVLPDKSGPHINPVIPDGVSVDKDGNLGITQYGITWLIHRDDGQYSYGEFVNGDFWVIGPVNIINITPASTQLNSGRIINGSMINPGPSWYQGYDNAIGGCNSNPPVFPDTGASYDASLNKGRPNGQDLSPNNPLVITEPSSLVSGVSYNDDPSHPITESNQVHLIAVLTILDSIPPEGAFRPPFTGTDKSITHTIKNLDYDLLPVLTPAAPINDIPDIATIADKFQKVWPDHVIADAKEERLPRDNMPAYGREVAATISDGALMLAINEIGDAKKLLAMRMVQIGLDINALVNQPGVDWNQGKYLYMANGGHCSGRGFLIVLAGYLLNDQTILNTMKKTGQYAYQGGYCEGNLPPDYIHLGETDQTFYVTARDVVRTNSSAWNPYTAGGIYQAAPYNEADATDSFPEWGIEHAADPYNDNKVWGSAYRSVNSVAWSGMILAARIMGIEASYNHPALFDYMDRWMNTETTSRAYNNFQETMWDEYRSHY